MRRRGGITGMGGERRRGLALNRSVFVEATSKLNEVILHESVFSGLFMHKKLTSGRVVRFQKCTKKKSNT